MKKDKDFVRYQGADVDVQLFKPVDGKKQFTGALGEFTDETITIQVGENPIVLERSAIAQIRLHFEF